MTKRFAFILSFMRHRGGNIALMFAIALVPMVVAAGLAIDMMRVSQIRAELDEAADAGLLAAAKAKTIDPNLTLAEAKAIVRNHLNFNYGGDTTDIIDTLAFSGEGDTYHLELRGQVPNLFLRVVGIDTSPVAVNIEVIATPPRALEVMMALDNTHSMRGQKIADLRSAATELVDTIMADTNNQVMVGLVPFATHVRIGETRRDAAWMAVPADSSYESNSCPVDVAAATSEGCYQQSATCTFDGVPNSCTQWVCPDGEGAPRDCSMNTIQTSWQGCVGSRAHPLNIRDADFLTDPVPGILNRTGSGGDCPSEILPMTTDKTSVENAITAMNAAGLTYIPGGLTWALRMISNQVPFQQGRTYTEIEDEGGQKAIVLMTDGENTRSPNPVTKAHYLTNVTLADQYTLELCDEIKDNDIALYTIAFDVTDTVTLDMMKDCATNSDSFFDASDADELTRAFGLIASSLIDLALTR